MKNTLRIILVWLVGSSEGWWLADRDRLEDHGYWLPNWSARIAQDASELLAGMPPWASHAPGPIDATCPAYDRAGRFKLAARNSQYCPWARQ